jgi:hypothetical protein
MTLPEPLAPLIGTLRTDVRGVGMTNWRLLEKTTGGCIDNALYYVRATPEIDEASEHVRQMCKQLANEIAERGVLYAQNHAPTKQARELALLAVDELENLLQDAKPSDEAICLSVGW